MSNSPKINSLEPTSPPSLPSFVLPPPPSDLLARLNAFLPQIKAANEQLAEQGPIEGDEAVILEEISSSEDEDDSTSSEEESSDEDSDEDEQEEEAMEEQGEADEAEEDPLKRLVDIAARPKITRKSLAGTMDEVSSGGAKSSGIVEMD